MPREDTGDSTALPVIPWQYTGMHLSMPACNLVERCRLLEQHACVSKTGCLLSDSALRKGSLDHHAILISRNHELQTANL